jgi:hypothetical protein
MGGAARLQKSPGMTSSSPLVRFCALVAPACLLVYSVLRWIDGLDGHHDHDSLYWIVGHAFFFIGFVLLAALMIGLRPMVPRGAVAAGVATAAAVAGAACFNWVTLGDLFERFPALPDVLQIVGPLLFEVGALTVLIQLVVARQLTVWSPVLVFLGFVALAVNLDLLPIASVLVGVGLVPLARMQPTPDRTAVPAGRL